MIAQLAFFRYPYANGVHTMQKLNATKTVNTQSVINLIANEFIPGVAGVPLLLFPIPYEFNNNVSFKNFGVSASKCNAFFLSK